MKRFLLFGIAPLALAGVAYGARAAQQQPRVFVLAVATVEPGHMTEYMGVVEDQILPFFAEQRVDLIGIFRNQVGGPSNQLIILQAYHDMAHVEAVTQNSTLTAIQQQTFESMRVLETKMLSPAPFTPLQ